MLEDLGLSSHWRVAARHCWRIGARSCWRIRARSCWKVGPGRAGGYREPGWLAGGGECLQVAEKQKMMEIILPTYSVRKLIFC